MERTPRGGDGQRPPGTGARVAGWIGLAVHVVLLFFPYLASGLIAPPAGVAGLLALWAVLLAAAIALLRRRPAMVPLVPVVAVALWAAVVTIGDRYWGWTA